MVISPLLEGMVGAFIYLLPLSVSPSIVALPPYQAAGEKILWAVISGCRNGGG